MSNRLTKEKFVAWASEAVYGTDTVGAAPTVFQQVITCEIMDVRADLKDESDRACASPGPADTISSHNEVTIESYLFGKEGAAGDAPAIDALMLACGLKKTEVALTSLTYTPNTATSDMTASPSATIKCWDTTTDGEAMLSTALGFRGNCTMVFQERQQARIRFEGRSRYVKRGNKAAHGLTKPTEYSGNKRALIVSGITFEIDAATFKVKNFEFTTNWELIEDRDATASTALDEIHLRRPKGQAMVCSLDFHTVEDLEVVLAKYNDAAADAPITITVVIGDGTDTITITAPRGVFMNRTETSGTVFEFAVPVELAGNYGVGTGDDELAIAYT